MPTSAVQYSTDNADIDYCWLATYCTGYARNTLHTFPRRRRVANLLWTCLRHGKLSRVLTWQDSSPCR